MYHSLGLTHTEFQVSERTKFLLAVIYGSLRRHSISSKTFKKNRKKIEIKFYDHFATS